MRYLPLLIFFFGISSAYAEYDYELNNNLKFYTKRSLVLKEGFQLKEGQFTIAFDRQSQFYFDSKLLIKQNGSIIRTTIPKSSFHNYFEFTLLREVSHLNFDIYLRLMPNLTIKEEFEEEEQDCQISNYEKLEMNSSIPEFKMYPGTQKVQVKISTIKATAVASFAKNKTTYATTSFDFLHNEKEVANILTKCEPIEAAVQLIEQMNL